MEAPRSKLNGAIEKKNIDIVVEVGSGRSPHIITTSPEYKERFNTGRVRYYAIDLDNKELMAGQNFTEATKPIEAIQYVQAHGSELPFPDRSVSEVVYSNVFGDPDIVSSEKKMLVTEAVRILKDKGILKVVESYTPWVATDDAVFERILLDFDEIEHASELPAFHRTSDDLLTARTEEMFGPNNLIIKRFRKRRS